MASRHKKRRLVVYAASASSASPPATPAADAKPGGSKLLAALFEIAAIVACIVGFIVTIKWLDNKLHPPLPPGWVSTSASNQRSGHCELAEGWHAEEWPGVGRVAVPDGGAAALRP
jgi:hypothetical protein